MADVRTVRHNNRISTVNRDRQRRLNWKTSKTVQHINTIGHIQAQDYYAFNYKFSNYSFQKYFLNPPIIIPTKIDVLTIIYANLLINTDNYKQLKITTLNRNEMLSTAKDFLIVPYKQQCGLKFKPLKVYNGLGNRTTALILNISAILK